MPSILTIGHSTLPLQAFLRILRDQGVGRVVDIRTIPRSRHNPQFARENLAPALEEAGIAWEWRRELGGLRHPRPNSINTAWKNSSFRGYADYMQTPQFAEALSALLSEEPEAPLRALLCAEAVPWRCHRSLVADALLARGIPVEHILYSSSGASRREPHRLTSFAKAEGDRLWYPGDLFAAAEPPEAFG